eukprot:6159551-Prorocentrum_lima.AAC.1
MELRRWRSEVKLVDPDEEITEKAFAGKLLKGSGLTREEQCSTLAAAGQIWDPTRLEDALLMMYSDALQDNNYKRDRRHVPRHPA